MCEGYHVGDEIYQYNFFSTIHPTILRMTSPGIMKKLIQPVMKNEQYIKKLLDEVAGRILKDDKYARVYYPDYILEEGEVSKYTFNEYIRALQEDDWKKDTYYSRNHNHIWLAAIASVFNAYQITIKNWLSNNFTEIDKKEFEQHIYNEEIGVEYINLLTEDNSYLKYHRDDTFSFIMLDKMGNIELLFAK